MTSEAERIAKGLTKAQARALTAIANCDGWVTAKDAGTSGTGAWSLIYGRGPTLIASQYLPGKSRTADCYCATDLGREVAAALRNRENDNA